MEKEWKGLTCEMSAMFLLDPVSSFVTATRIFLARLTVKMNGNCRRLNVQADKTMYWRFKFWYTTTSLNTSKNSTMSEEIAKYASRICDNCSRLMSPLGRNQRPTIRTTRSICSNTWYWSLSSNSTVWRAAVAFVAFRWRDFDNPGKTDVVI